MGTSEHIIKNLLLKYAKNTISEQELDELHSVLGDSMNEDEIKKTLDQQWKTLLDNDADIDVDFSKDFFQLILKKAKDREQPTSRKLTISPSWYRIAAVFVGIITIAGLAYFMLDINVSDKVDLSTHQTGIGERKTILLPDGSKATLNVASQLIFPEIFNDTIREIHLKGEAFFEVARNEQQPFVIRTVGLETRVLGTSFNVKAYRGDEQVQVSVATGKVKVSNKTEGSPTLSRMILKPGDQAVYSIETGNLVKQHIDPKVLASWRKGILVFEKTTLGDVVKTLERWYGVDIELENNAISACQIRSKLDNASLDDAIETLKFILNVDYENKDGKVVLKGGSCGSSN